MGILDKLFGGHAQHSSSTSTTQPPARNNTSSDSGQENMSPRSAFAGKHFEGLGDIWTALLPGGSKEYVAHLQELFEKSHPQGPVMQRKDGTSVLLLASPSFGGIAIHSHITMKQGQEGADFVGGYPFLEGIPVQARIEQVHIWSDGISGVVAASLPQAPLPCSWYLAGFFQHAPQLQFGGTAEFRISGLALSLSKAENSVIPMEKGTPVYDVELNKFLEQNPGKTEDDFQHPAISLHGRSLMLPTEVVGISEFHFPVQEVQHGEILGHHFVRLRVTIAGFGENSVQGWMYASDHILKGYEPQVGDDISGVFWMQGSMDKYPQFSAD